MKLKRAILVWLAVFCAALAMGCHYTGARYADYYINWYNGGTGDYYHIFNEEARTDPDAWSPYTDVYLNPVSSSGNTDHINVYNGHYGLTGWLGYAEWNGSGDSPTKYGRARLNQTYLDNGYTRTHKKHVACHEIGHLLGLAHNRSQADTCMNDTIFITRPNAHDRDAINAIY